MKNTTKSGNLTLKQIGETLDSNSVLWRYFDFQKFLSFIIEKSIFFSRLDNMEDTNEGISFNQLLYKYGDEFERQFVNESKTNSKKSELKLEFRQKKYFVSCWLFNHRESVAMWNSYSNSDGIALKVNSNNLIDTITKKSTINDHNDKMKYLYFGKIIYKDFLNQNDRMNLKEETKIIGFHKDICFEHEKEFRFLFKQDLHNHKNDDIPLIKLQLLNFNKLKFEVIFHPKMEPWKKNNIKSVVSSLGIKNIKFKDSELQLKNW